MSISHIRHFEDKGHIFYLFSYSKLRVLAPVKFAKQAWLPLHGAYNLGWGWGRTNETSKEVSYKSQQVL